MTEITPALGLSAYFLGRRIVGQRRKPERVPVAYLYNGVRLPPFPTHGGYTYEMISFDTPSFGGDKTYCAWITTVPWQKDFIGCSTTEEGSGYGYVYNEESVWERASHWEDKSVPYPPINPIWSNHEILKDGSPLPIKSDPIPVYE